MKRGFCGLVLLATLFSGAAAADQPMTREQVGQLLGGTQKIVSSNGVDEARAVTIGGIQQWITVRGRDRRNPILLVLHGGPAAPDLANRYLFEGPWTDYFTVVEWDQRGAGKTYGLNDPKAVAATLSRERMTQDAEELVDYLRKTYGKEKIFVMGHSWGSVLGLGLAQRHPEWLYAYVGVGQVIDTREGEKIGYDFALQAAKADHNGEAVRELEAIAPYPEADGALPLAKIGVQRKWSVHYGGLAHGRDNYGYWANAQTLSPDYSQADLDAIAKGSAVTLPALLPELAKIDFNDLRKLDCPIVMFAGRYDYTTPSSPVETWYLRLKAPAKRFVWFENSAHMIAAEEPGRMLVHLVQDVLPLAEPGRKHLR
ncbi:MAG: alpha/beta hydrolase [Caulobacter sp.]|nr:alpha/beta hydrolase [Caulobacter sp.]